jgi:hypothetical protein
VNLENLIFWNFRRGSRPYDLIVALILAFIFITPRDWFGDTPQPRRVALVSSSGGQSVFWIEPNSLQGAENQWSAEAARLIENQAKVKVRQVKVTAVTDDSGGVKGYMATTHQ